MPKKIVAERNVKMADFHRNNDTIAGKRRERLRVFYRSDERTRDRIGVRSSGESRMASLGYQRDDLTVEEPLEIRVGRKTLATTMRTPGHDEELAAGFLVSEGIVRKAEQIAQISRPADSADRGNIIVVELAGGVKLKLSSTKRFGTISTSCGICGKNSIAAIRQNFPAIGSAKIRIDIEMLLSLPDASAKTPGRFCAHRWNSRGRDF